MCVFVEAQRRDAYYRNDPKKYDLKEIIKYVLYLFVLAIALLEVEQNIVLNLLVVIFLGK